MKFGIVEMVCYELSEQLLLFFLINGIKGWLLFNDMFMFMILYNGYGYCKKGCECKVKGQ